MIGKGRLRCQRVDPRVEGGEFADLLRPGRREAPAHLFERALAIRRGHDRNLGRRRDIVFERVIAEAVVLDPQLDPDLVDPVRRSDPSAYLCLPPCSFQIESVLLTLPRQGVG